jgi:hypothetical protein
VTRLRIVQGARGEFGLVPLHRGVRRIPFEHMAHHDPDAVYCRGLSPTEVAYLEHQLAPIRAQNELRRIREKRDRLNKIVAVTALVVAVFTIAYFAAQMLRAVV